MRSWLKGAYGASVSHGADDVDLHAAYERGRRDERARHPPRPLLGLLMVGTALVGGTALVLAATNGSFKNGGAVIDHQIAAVTAGPAEPPVRYVGDETADAFTNADLGRQTADISGE
jgi:hypothetical protein